MKSEVFIGNEVCRVQCELESLPPGVDLFNSALITEGLIDGYQVIKGIVKIEKKDENQVVYISVMNNSTEPKSRLFYNVNNK